MQDTRDHSGRGDNLEVVRDQVEVQCSRCCSGDLDTYSSSHTTQVKAKSCHSGARQAEKVCGVPRGLLHLETRGISCQIPVRSVRALDRDRLVEGSALFKGKGVKGCTHAPNVSFQPSVSKGTVWGVPPPETEPSPEAVSIHDSSLLPAMTSANDTVNSK